MHPAGIVDTGFAADSRPKPEFRLANNADLQPTYLAYVIAKKQLSLHPERRPDLRKQTLPVPAWDVV
jgi:hypothetical protein